MTDSVQDIMRGLLEESLAEAKKEVAILNRSIRDIEERLKNWLK